MGDVLHVEWSYGEQGAKACREGQPCDPPEELHMIVAMSWAAGWLDESDEHPTPYTTNQTE
ncbi:hypothetical protein [Salinibacter altiplanensis]|uniref:hypothetical protein n=1 Tax=Salinibacter altiplanensis TaxID=1803181 RepID=UPI000C9F3235|nr:hypothetical protein [Salinibacter altiplanensis]